MLALLTSPATAYVVVTAPRQDRLAEARTLVTRAQQEQLPADATEHDRESFAAMQADQQANLLRAQATCSAPSLHCDVIQTVGAIANGGK